MIKRLTKSRNIKKIAIVLLIMFVSSWLLNGDAGLTNAVFAADGTTNKMDFVQIIDVLLKVIYILLRPLLVIAGTALDNSMVYASFLHLDAPLWKFWNIIKNFANFALGFVVLFAIIRKIFSFGKAGDKREPTKIITQTLIAGVLIQASRFMMAALVDLSTVATYAIGGLPLNVLGSTNLGHFKILKVNSSLDLSKYDAKDKNIKYFDVWYSTKFQGSVIQIAECRKSNGYIMGRASDNAIFDNTAFGVGKNACVAGGGSPIILNEFDFKKMTQKYDIETYQNWAVSWFNEDILEACGFIVRANGKPQTKYTNCSAADAAIKKVQSDIDNDSSAESGDKADVAEFVKQINAANTNNIGTAAGKTWLDNNGEAMSIDQLIKGSKGFVGPLVTIYSSMLNFAQMSNTQSDTTFGEMSGEMIIKILFAIGLFFPLLALAVVLIVRIGFLWMVIVMSPFLVLVKAFDRGGNMEGLMKDVFNIGNVIKVIFAPVITVFALSISLIFMSTLVQSLNTNNGDDTTVKQGIEDSMHVKSIPTGDANHQKIRVMDSFELDMFGEGWTVGGTLDGFSRFLINLMAIGIMRAIVFTAIRSNSIGKELGSQIESFGTSMFKTLPIVPIGGEKIGIGSLGTAAKTYPASIMKQRETDQVKEALDRRGSEKSSISSSEANTIINKITTKSNSTDVNKLIEAETGSSTLSTENATAIANAINSSANLKTVEEKMSVAEKVAGLGKKGLAKNQLDAALGKETKAEEASKKLESLDIKYKEELLGEEREFLGKKYKIENNDGTYTFNPVIEETPAGTPAR